MASASQNLTIPSLKLCNGIVDTHFHVFGPERIFPYADGRSYTPIDATMEAYAGLAKTLGIGAAVLVQPSVYGNDNRRLIAALQNAPFPMRGIAVVSPDTDDCALDRMHDAGVRGLRINLVFSAGQGLATAQAMASRLQERGWHFQFLVDVSTIPNLYDRIRKLDVPVVFDHLGHVRPRAVTADPGFTDLLRLVSERRAWVKLTGAYRVSAQRHPPYSDVAPMAKRLITAAPTQVLWGTDWPHSAITSPLPDDEEMLKLARYWIADDTARQDILTWNAVRLYGFSAEEIRI